MSHPSGPEALEKGHEGVSTGEIDKYSLPIDRSVHDVHQKLSPTTSDGDHFEKTFRGKLTLKWNRHARPIVHLLCVLVLLGWWIPGLILTKTRHKWVVTTFWTWTFLLIILFQWVPTSSVTRPISKIWNTLITTPFMFLPRFMRFGIGWLAVIGLFAGSAFGLPLPSGTKYVDRIISLCGVGVCQLLFWITSRNRKGIKWRTVIVGLASQQILALFVMKTDAGYDLFSWIATAATDFLDQGTKAAGFFFSEDIVKRNWFFVNTLGAIIFFVAMVHLLYHLGVMQVFLLKFGWLLQHLMGVSGAEAVVAAATPFVGQGESILLVKPFASHMTPSELHQCMTSGFATIAGSVLTAYVGMGMPAVFLISASVMSIPASLALGKLRWPEDRKPATLGKMAIPPSEITSENNAMQAFSKGAWVGLRVAGMILANLLTMLGLLYVIDGLLTWIGQFWNLDPLGPHPLTLELILQYLLWPVAFLMGTPRNDVLKVSRLLGLKMISNEFVAYQELSRLRPSMESRSITIAIYSLCGFANLGSLGIQVGVLIGIAPSKKNEITQVALSALICGFFSTIQTAAIAGMVL